jgi:hypothetical protein
MTRSARALAIGPAVTALAALVATSAGASATKTLQASHTLLPYGTPVTLGGHVAARAKVQLEADAFPFRNGYRLVGAKRAGADGSYTFTARPSHATHYRVRVTHAGKTKVSRAISVYVDERVEELLCNLCNVAYAPGAHTLTVQYSAEAPPGKVGVFGPVYFYYGQADGSSPPESVSLVKKVALNRRGRTLSYSVSYAVDFPSTAFEFRVVACFKAAEALDGVGLPGHHHCGDRSLTRQQYLGYLG